ncbi:phenylalanine--tRNA ligase subunit alpha [Candidatus Photodesmus blepharus]|nr:phenylalanine--tRNA ligase subunit alpha [Candidatus Photodesmus blepharus]
MQCLKDIIASAFIDVKTADSLFLLDKIRVQYLGKKGELTVQLRTLSQFPVEERSIVARAVNQAKKEIQQAILSRKKVLEYSELQERLAIDKIDVTLPGRRIENGNLHPITHVIDRIEDFFTGLGFNVELGPEIEDTFHNFDALNIPRNHPARTDHDTFFFDSTLMLRTHTSGVQIRTMKKGSPPFCFIVPGRVYRNDCDSTHTPMFHQVEGVLVDQNVSFAQLKGILSNFLLYFFGKEVEVRFRSSYFPFTEPSAEVDVKDKDGKWLEVLGCGMVHPNVFRSVNIDSEKYSGFAFGIGVERLAMLSYGVNDLRLFFQNDLRFLKQFK